MTRRHARAGASRAAAVLATTLLLAGCGGSGSSDEDGGATGTPATGSTPAGDPHADEAWNPCDALAVARVGRALGAAVTADRGPADAPRCALLPTEDGGPVLDVNYMPFPDGLDAAWDSMGAPEDGSVSEPTIRGADAARLVVQVGDGGATATGFVQNGALIHVVNAADTSPFDRDALLRGVRLVMTQLSAHAAEAAALAGTD